MCGICGIVYSKDSGKHVTGALLKKMRETLSHRGPDDAGQYLDETKRIGIAHRRLSIIDLSDAAHQPMADGAGEHSIAFNGEVYNFKEIRRELEANGHVFSSTSDTEVVLHAYIEWGAGCLERFNGMFAFAVLDRKRRKLFLARDRIGIKPLFYYADGTRFAFASEMKAILEAPGLTLDVSPESIEEYLTFLYIPAPATIFTQVRKLMPGCFLELDLDGAEPAGSFRTARYWDFNDMLADSAKLDITEDEAAARLKELLSDSVRLRMIADVPLGAFLSGGVDSSAIVAMMAQHAAGRVQTFAIAFEEAAFDESHHARAVAAHLGTEHREFTVQPEAMDVMEKLVRHLDEPFADSSALPTYFVSKLTREHVTVALSGDGGDEVWAGYTRYLGEKLSNLYRRLPAFLRKKFLYRIVKHFPRLGGLAYKLNRLTKVLEDAELESPLRYASKASTFTAAERAGLFTPEFKERLGGFDVYGQLLALFKKVDSRDFLDTITYADTTFYLPNDMLTKVDRMSMAPSLEVRVPFLDHRMVEFAARVSHAQKLKGFRLKHLLKKAMRPHLPPAILRRGKQGFGVPIAAWFKGSLADYARDILLGARATARGYFDAKAVGSMLDRHKAGGADLSSRIWAMLMFELWHRSFIDR